MTEPRRGSSRTGRSGPQDPLRDPARPEPPRDPGAYIGRKPERATETIPGGLGGSDRRVSATGTQPGPARGPSPDAAAGDGTPSGHREGTSDPALQREAGQDR